MTRENTYTITKDLEGLVGNANTIGQLLEHARANPKIDNVRLREQTATAFDKPFLRAAEPAIFVKHITARKQETYETLTDKLSDETYKQAIPFYTSKIDERVKSEMYVELLKEGIAPEKPSDKLKEAIKRIQLAEGIERALNSEDLDTARGIAAQYLRESQRSDIEDYMVTGSGYGLLGQKEVLRDVAQVQKRMAAAQIAQENLYSEIDGAIENAKYGKAITFVAAYNAYNQQEEINKAKAEKKDK